MLAISSHDVMRCPSGIRDSICFLVSSGAVTVESHEAYIGVQHSATITALTRMSYLASSTAHSRVSAFRPPFAAA